MGGRRTRHDGRPWWDWLAVAGATFIGLAGVVAAVAALADPRWARWLIGCVAAILVAGCVAILGGSIWTRRLGVGVSALAFFLAIGLSWYGSGSRPENPSAEQLNGTDPTKGCANGSGIVHQADILDENGQRIAELEVRYSPACETNWVRVHNTVEGALVEKYISVVGGYSDEESDRGTGWSYGMQVYAPGETCVDVSAVISRDGVPVGDYSTQVC